MGKPRKKKPEKRKASRIFENSLFSSMPNTVKASFSNADGRWHLKLLKLITKYLAIVKIIQFDTKQCQ